VLNGSSLWGGSADGYEWPVKQDSASQAPLYAEHVVRKLRVDSLWVIDKMVWQFGLPDCQLFLKVVKYSQVLVG
jgi:hypothetical protein